MACTGSAPYSPPGHIAPCYLRRGGLGWRLGGLGDVDELDLRGHLAATDLDLLAELAHSGDLAVGPLGQLVERLVVVVLGVAGDDEVVHAGTHCSQALDGGLA